MEILINKIWEAVYGLSIMFILLLFIYIATKLITLAIINTVIGKINKGENYGKERQKKEEEIR